MTQKAESNVTMGAERKTWRCYRVLALETEEMSQESNVPLEAGKGKEAHSPLVPPGGAQWNWLPTPGLQNYHRKTCVVLSHQVRSNLLQKPQEAYTQLRGRKDKLKLEEDICKSHVKQRSII